MQGYVEVLSEFDEESAARTEAEQRIAEAEKRIEELEAEIRRLKQK